MMPDRAYTVAEVDALRAVCESKWLWGAFFHPRPEFRATDRGHGYQSFVRGRSYRESEKDIGVEQLVRTYMMAGITVDDIRAEYEASEKAASDGAYEKFMRSLNLFNEFLAREGGAGNGSTAR